MAQAGLGRVYNESGPPITPESAKGAAARSQAAKKPARYLGGALDTVTVLRVSG